MAQCPLTLSDLRKTILGLRMNGFAYIDDESVLDQVRFRIEKLPSAEELDNLKDSAEALINIGDEVGKIAELIELGSKRDENYKVRNMARKNMPPRYQVLEWRQNMKQEAARLVKDLVRISARADEVGFEPMASHLITTAKKIREEKDARIDIIIASSFLKQAGMTKEAKVVEAGFGDMWSGLKGGLGGVWEGAKTMGHQIIDPAKTNAAYARALQMMNDANKNVQVLMTSLQKSMGGIRQPDMKNVVAQMIQQLSNYHSNAAQVGEALTKMKPQLDWVLKQTTVPVGQAPGQGGAAEQGAGASAAPGQGAQGSTTIDNTNLEQVTQALQDSAVGAALDAKENDLIASLMKNNIDINSLTPEQAKKINELKNYLNRTMRKYEKTPAAKQALEQEIAGNQAGGTATQLQPVDLSGGGGGKMPGQATVA